MSNVGGQSQVTIRGVIGVGDLDKEQLTIVNTGGDMSLVGWTIHDSQGNVFFFPALALFQGGAVTVHTKSGTNTVIDLYWNQSTTMWQTGEVVSLVDPSGTTQTTYTIP
ncbi:MAG: lamin tail domain-containing protein [Chloroflexi bacterium]|nr:lamin tail domain-containing protein [Chloroflexota bacterium]